MHRGACLALVSILACGLAHADTEPATDLGELLESFRGLAPAPSGFSAAGETLEVGRFSLELEDGGLFPIRGKRDELLGLYFEGHGLYAYRSDEPRDRAVIAGNLARNAPRLTLNTVDSTVRDTFERCVVFFARPLFEDRLTGDPVPLPGDGRATFDKIWKRIGLTHLEYDHLAAEALLNPGDLQYVYAEIEGSIATVGYTYDRVRYTEEGLWAFDRYPGVDYRFRVRLSKQALSMPTDGLGMANIRDARVKVDTADNRGGTIDSDLTIEPARDGLAVVTFLLVNNRAPASWDWRSTTNQLRVKRVVDGEGRELAYSHRYNELLIQLARPVNRGDELVLRVETEGEIFTDSNNERREEYFELFSVPWFPHAFRWDATPYTFELTARTRKPYFPVASGTTTVREDGDFYVLESKSNRAVDLVALFAGKYKTVEQMAGPTRVRVHMYLSAPKKMTETLPGLVAELLRFYGDQLGPYPFEELDLVGTPETRIGIAPSGMALLPEGTYKPMLVKERTSVQRYLVRSAPALIAHEVAHQWFGHKVTPAAPEENWLAESFSEYLSGLALGAGQTANNRVVGFKEMLDDWRFTAAECADVGSLETANTLGGEKGFEDRFCLLYARGPLVLHMFRTIVGDNNFFIILRKFLDQANYGPASTADFKKVVQETLRSDMGWFVDQWFAQSGIPTIAVEQHVVPNQVGGYGLNGKVSQPVEGFKKMVIPFIIEYPDGHREAKLVLQEKPVQDFGFALVGKPSSVKVDPSKNNLANYR